MLPDISSSALWHCLLCAQGLCHATLLLGRSNVFLLLLLQGFHLTWQPGQAPSVLLPTVTASLAEYPVLNLGAILLNAVETCNGKKCLAWRALFGTKSIGFITICLCSLPTIVHYNNLNFFLNYIASCTGVGKPAAEQHPAQTRSCSLPDILGMSSQEIRAIRGWWRQLWGRFCVQMVLKEWDLWC